MVCPPVLRDNPRALTRGLSLRTSGQPWFNFIPQRAHEHQILDNIYIRVNLVDGANIGKGGTKLQ